MSSACTPHRLVGRRVRRKFASCFFARRIRLEKKTDVDSSRSPETSNGSIIFDFSRRKATEREDREKSVQNSPSHSNRFNGGESEPHVVDDDYLVFSFGEDGAIDFINEDNHINHHEERKASDKIDEKRGENDESEAIIEQEDRNKMDRFESCDSNLSDTSSGSFAFPILKIEEWIGSPVHMPSHGDQNVRLHCCRF